MYTVAAIASNGQDVFAGGAGGLFAALMPFILIFVIFYFLLILPQRKKEKEHMEMVKNLKKGDKVITTGGIYGTITKLRKNYVEIEVSENTKLKVQRHCISQLRGKE
ncbi:MAG TPA: preprotein translocase subunit YajC [Candidatus Aerophobetes bacterium]|nr:preprotein translocase subunit YajC [Candidatus Aerophobetes bacterium]